MLAFINLYWDRLSDGRYGAFLSFAVDDQDDLPSVLIEDVLPAYAQNAAHEPGKAADFIELLQIFLAPQSHWDDVSKTTKGATKANPKRIDLPPVDLQHYGFIDSNGTVQPEQVRGIIAAIAPVWENDPPLGLVYEVIGRGHTPAELKTGLRLHYQPREAHQELLKILQPPECRSGDVAMTEAQLTWCLTWLRRPGMDQTIQDKQIGWIVGMRELEMIVPTGQISRAAAEAASAFIWSHRGQEPDFFALQRHLAAFQVHPSRKPRRPTPNIVIKRTKRQQKAIKQQRKRGRR